MTRTTQTTLRFPAPSQSSPLRRANGSVTKARTRGLRFPVILVAFFAGIVGLALLFGAGRAQDLQSIADAYRPFAIVPR